MSENTKSVTLYIDGGCEPNPGPGGYGIVMLYGAHRREVSGGFQLTTNNRMEIYAAIKALELLKEPCNVRLHSDSRYVVDAISLGWAQRWRTHNWKRSAKEKAANPDLWEKLLALCAIHRVEFVWVRGHAGNTENERCDVLAMQALHQPDLPPDDGYATPSQPEQARLII
jgi:ribonuclease HI